MASQPNQKKTHCTATVVFVDNKAESKNGRRIRLKGKNGEFKKIMEKAREICSKSVSGNTPTLTLFLKKKDGSQAAFGDDETLRGT